MVLNEPDATSFDLRFRLFGVYVRVHPLFWLISVILGWDLTRHPVISDNGLTELLLWVVACFVSILLHEFGHVWMGQYFGSNGHILLHGMGGLAIGSSNLSTRWKRILVIAAGPGIQLALYGLLYLGVKQGYLQLQEKHLVFFISLMMTINLLWPLLNLLPIFPLDGGQITREICAGVSARQGVLVSLWISLTVAVVLALNALAGESGRDFLPPIYGFSAPRGTYIAIMFAFFAISSWQLIQQEQNKIRYAEDDVLPWER